MQCGLGILVMLKFDVCESSRFAGAVVLRHVHVQNRAKLAKLVFEVLGTDPVADIAHEETHALDAALLGLPRRARPRTGSRTGPASGRWTMAVVHLLWHPLWMLRGAWRRWRWLWHEWLGVVGH